MKNLKAIYYNILFFFTLMLFASTNAVADDTLMPKSAETTKKALAAAVQAATLGPAEIRLLDQATLKLPNHYMYIPTREGKDLMRALGNSMSAKFVGLVMPTNQDDLWIISIEYTKSGYIKDNDAKNWNSDQLLQGLKEGVVENNKERNASGFPTLDIIGWIQSPSYITATHQLIWSIHGKNSNGRDFVNYNTYALGREGYFEFDLLTDLVSVEKNKQDSNKILSALNYDIGKRYHDYKKGGDRVAAYGLAALVTGIVAKKLGLLALIGVFLIKIWKILIIACLAFLGGIKKFFKRDRG